MEQKEGLFSRFGISLPLVYLNNYSSLVICMHINYFDATFQLRESKGMTTIKFRPHSGEVPRETALTFVAIHAIDRYASLTFCIIFRLVTLTTLLQLFLLLIILHMESI